MEQREATVSLFRYHRLRRRRLDLDANEIVRLFDRIGIVAVALGGGEVGARRRLDVFGLLVMGVVSATGGGLLRDVILGRIPFVLAHADYLLWASLSSVVGIVFVWKGRAIPPLLLEVAAAAGLGAFAAAGSVAALETDLPLPAVLAVAVVTATGGGVLRDLLADRVPLVLRAEVNATAAIIGGLVVWALAPASQGGAALAGALVAAGLRVVTMALGLHLPAPAGRSSHLE